MFKKCTAVCLPTNQKATNGSVVFNNNTKELGYNYNSDLEQLKKALPSSCDYTTQHLHILSDDKIEVGDWVLNQNWINNPHANSLILCTERAFANPEWLNSEDCKNCKKIIASTDPTLNLPSPSPEFLKVFCEKQPKEVMVKYTYNELLGISEGDWPQVKDNQISIKKIKQSYSRNEVIEIIKQVQEDTWIFINGRMPGVESYL